VNSAFAAPGRHHAIWKEWRRIGKGKDERFFLEHRQAVMESLSGRHAPQQVLLAEELYQTEPARWDDLASRHSEVRWYLVDGQSLDQVASVSNSSGLCGLFAPRPSTLSALTKKSFLLVAWEISDPGNLGTLVRAVQALGDGALLAVGGCAAWSSKVARASAGSLLKCDLVRLAREHGGAALRELQKAGFELRGAFPRAERTLSELDWSGRCAVLLGNETRGLPSDLEELTQGFRIPISSEVESLNVAMAGSIVIWEWRRQHS
jgi:TrmH family RNA methyltransferase